MLRNRYAKDIGGMSIGQKIIHKKPQEGVVLTPALGIGGLIHRIHRRQHASTDDADMSKHRLSPYNAYYHN